MIKGLNPRLLEVGKIKIGGKGEKKKSQKGTDYRPPVKYNSFLVTTTERGPGGVDGDLITDSETMKNLGNEPRSIAITFPFDDIDLNFHTAYQFYKDKKMLCSSDGETAHRDNGNGEYVAQKCGSDKCRDYIGKQCKISGIMSCHIDKSPHIDGIYRYRTHGWNSVTGILAALMKYRDEAGGILQGLPLNLIFVKKSTAHGNIGAATVERGVSISEFRRMAISEKLARKELNIDIHSVEELARADGYGTDTDDPEEVQAEYFPEFIQNDTPDQRPALEKEQPGTTSTETADNLFNDKHPVTPDPKIAERENEVSL